MDAGPYFQLTVVAKEAGSTDTAFSGKITLSLAANPGGATLGGNLTMPVNNGVVTFYGLTLNVAASGYTIQATGSGITSAISSPITVVNPPSQLSVKIPPPAGVASNRAFGLTVAVDDAFGGPASDYNGNVTIALSSKRGKTKLRGAAHCPGDRWRRDLRGLDPERGSQRSLVTAPGHRGRTRSRHDEPVHWGGRRGPSSSRDDPRQELTGIDGLNRRPAGPRRRGRRSHPRFPSGP